MKRLAFVLAAALFLGFFVGCKQIQTIVQKEEVITRYVDSTIWHNDTAFFQVPVEVYHDYTSLLDTLRMENKYCSTWSAVDTNKLILIGELKTKDIKIPVEYKWKERLIINDTTIYQEKEVPVPVEVKVKYIPWYAKISMVWAVLSMALLGIWAYFKFWRH